MISNKTLRMQLKRPGTSNRDVSNYPISGVVGALNNYMADSDLSMGCPQKEAIVFYSTNHIMSEVLSRNTKDSPLNTHISMVDKYQSELSKSSVRMFYYLLLICTRESRHVYSNYDWGTAVKKYGKPAINFTKSISSCGSESSVKEFRNSNIDTTIGEYTAHLYELFNTGEFSGGYGGKAWAEVALVLTNFVHGVYTAEIMMDTAFTLCHNNGPIFNKGMLYNHHKTTILQEILDIQRSGQIPELIKSETSNYVRQDILEFIISSENLLNTQYSNYVDWFKVGYLGGLGNYTSHQKNQEKAHGLPKDIQQQTDNKNKKELEDKLEKEKNEKRKKDKYFNVMVGIRVEKLKIEREES